MRLDETPEEELERMGEGISLSTGVWNASIPDLHLPEPRALYMSEGRSSHRLHHVAVVVPWRGLLQLVGTRTVCSSSP